MPQASPTTKSVLTRFSEAWLKVELGRLLRREKKRRNKKEVEQEFACERQEMLRWEVVRSEYWKHSKASVFGERYRTDLMNKSLLLYEASLASLKVLAFHGASVSHALL